MHTDHLLEWLYKSRWFGVKLGLESARRLAGWAGHQSYSSTTAPDSPLVIHVAGTNGKGSVCAMLESILRQAGFKTGLFTSPHLISFNERIQINRQPLPEAELHDLLQALHDEVQPWTPHPTFFELATGLALAAFKQNHVDVVILETGLGGRLDATNVIPAHISLITPIALDHQTFLGETLAEIAFEKAGIFKSGIPAISALQAPAAKEVLQEQAAKTGTPLSFVETPWTSSPIGLVGPHQAWNAALALKALSFLPDKFSGKLSPSVIQQGLQQVQWPARFQVLQNHWILDGAHNPHSATALVETWKTTFPDESPILVLGMAADKDTQTIWQILAPLAHTILTVPIPSERSADPAELAKQIQQAFPHKTVSSGANIADLFPELTGKQEKILIAGSLFLVGEALKYLTAPTSISSPNEVIRN